MLSRNQVQNLKEGFAECFAKLHSLVFSQIGLDVKVLKVDRLGRYQGVSSAIFASTIGRISNGKQNDDERAAEENEASSVFQQAM